MHDRVGRAMKDGNDEGLRGTALPHDALAIARRLCGQVLDEFGLEIGRGDAQLTAPWEAYVLAVDYALSCGGRSAGDARAPVVVALPSPHLDRLLAWVGDQGTPRERLDPFGLLNSCAAWGLREIERVARGANGGYDLSPIRSAIIGGGVGCDLCGAQNPFPPPEKCGHCGAYLEP